MAFPSDLVRTKDWGTEVLTDNDLEAQLDNIIDWVGDAFGMIGHTHSGASNQGPKIPLTTSVTGTLPIGNGGTGLSTGFVNGAPIGSMYLWGTIIAPTNHLICDGSAVSRITYANLFTAIGTTFGVGDSSTTFNLPNFKGRVSVGYDASQTEFDSMGEQGGEKTHTLITSEIPAHTHDLVSKDDNGGSSNIAFTGSSSANRSTTSSSTGGDGAHNNIQPYMAINYIIKYA